MWVLIFWQSSIIPETYAHEALPPQNKSLDFFILFGACSGPSEIVRPMNEMGEDMQDDV